MRKLWLEFTHPWLLLLIIPAVALVLIPYFRTAKKFRRTRNKVTTVVLQLIVMVLSITVLSGLTVHAEINNKSNKVILLVDVSDTEETVQEDRDNFVFATLNAGKFDKFDIGIVTFGYDQVYAVPFTDKTKDAYDRYLNAPKPDTTATDIASALTYAAGLFPENSVGKIVLVTDGKQTDRNALTVIRSISAQGITVDAVNIKSGFKDRDVRISSVEMPDYHVNAGELLTLKVTVSGCNYGEQESEKVAITLYDNGKEVVTDSATGEVGTTEVDVGNTDKTANLSLMLNGDDPLHRIEVKLGQGSGGSLEQNDAYTTYYLVEKFDRVLILERGEKVSSDGESANSDDLAALLSEQGYTVTIMNVSDDEQAGLIPKTVDDLRAFDQVVLNNISNADLVNNVNVPDKFVENLYTYVHDFGGGLLTTGGQDDTGANANSYRREDLSGSLLQSMLPVQAIEYTPPVAVMIIIDRSGSMSAKASGGFTRLKWAKEAAGESLNALTERDYAGVMTLDSYESYVVPLTPMTQKEVILSGLREKIEATGGGTVFTDAIRGAALALKGNKNVDRRHIIIITDGAMSETGQAKTALENILHDNFVSDKITLSVVGIGIAQNAAASMQDLIDAAGGQESGVEGGRKVLAYTDNKLETLPRDLREELNVPQIKSVNDGEPFYITAYDKTSNIVKGVSYITENQTVKDPVTGQDTTVQVATSQIDTPKLGRFYGTKVRNKDYLVLTGDYEVPLYAQWKFGKGSVGSLMTDLQGSRGVNSDFMNSAVGKTIIGNIINTLMPVTSVRQTEMRLELDEDNYTNRLSIFTDLKEGETVEGVITDVARGESSAVAMNSVTERGDDDAVYITSPMNEANGYGKCSFTVRKAGVYLITITKKDGEGNVISVSTAYKSFAYSEEYDTSAQNGETDYNVEFFVPITTAGKGTLVADPEDPSVIYDNFKKTLERVFDPRYVFMIIAIVLFVTEIAVRKFKFKWPHEIIRAYIAKRKGSQA